MLPYDFKSAKNTNTRNEPESQLCVANDPTAMITPACPAKAYGSNRLKMVELCGIEPQTSSVQGKRSPS